MTRDEGEWAPLAAPLPPSTPQALGEPAYVQLEGLATQERKLGVPATPATLRWTADSHQQQPGPLLPDCAVFA